MKNHMWSAVYELFQEIDKIRRGSFFYKTTQAQGSQPETGNKASIEDIMKLRAHIRTQLDVLKTKLIENLTEREVYLILFPIVIYLDELIMSDILSIWHTKWPALQKELFKIDNGGEFFYETLDNILRKPDTIPFIYEVFYFCLNDGFKGKYIDDILKINEYKRVLKEKIPVPELDKKIEEIEKTNLMNIPAFPLWYYIVTILSLVGVYFVIYFLVNHRVGS